MVTLMQVEEGSDDSESGDDDSRLRARNLESEFAQLSGRPPPHSHAQVNIPRDSDAARATRKRHGERDQYLAASRSDSAIESSPNSAFGGAPIADQALRREKREKRESLCARERDLFGCLLQEYTCNTPAHTNNSSSDGGNSDDSSESESDEEDTSTKLTLKFRNYNPTEKKLRLFRMKKVIRQGHSDIGLFVVVEISMD